MNLLELLKRPEGTRLRNRRDRRKDQLLRENGFFILRFLAEDVGKELDLVLDTILRSMSREARALQPNRIIPLSRRTQA